MAVLIHSQGASGFRRALLFGVGGLFGLAFIAAVVLWARVGSAVFFDMIAAGIAYCF